MRKTKSVPILLIAALLSACTAALAQESDDAVVVNALRDPVHKSYRRMLAGMDRFEKRHRLAPDATLRFKLLPRHPGTRMEEVQVEIVSDSVTIPVAVAPDRTFTLQRDRTALQENASVIPNRKAKTMTWRAEIRSPGLPPNTRRLGDLRLECEVGMAAGLISNYRRSIIAWLANLVPEGPEYCNRAEARYLFFAERPIFSVSLLAGTRREALPVERLYAGATRDPEWKEDLPYCDCEVLVDRAYFLPLGERSWPDDTLVEFEYLDSEPADDPVSMRGSTRADVRAAFGEPVIVDFDSGYEVWAYREKPSGKASSRAAELVLLFAPSGVVTKTRIR